MAFSLVASPGSLLQSQVILQSDRRVYSLMSHNFDHFVQLAEFILWMNPKYVSEVVWTLLKEHICCQYFRPLSSCNHVHPMLTS